MSFNLQSLLHLKTLGLSQRGAATSTLETPIGWVASTEVENPQPFLSGGELVLTTGARLKTAASQRVFIRAAKRAGAVGVGFGVGFGYSAVPESMIAEANRWDLPLLEVPYQTPFVAIVKRVADSLNADHVVQLQRLLAAHQSLAQALLSSNSRGGSGLENMLGLLGTLVGTDVVLEQYGMHLYSSAPDAVISHEAWLPTPVPTGKRDACTLWLRKPVQEAEIVDYAKNLVSIELVNQSRRRADARKVTGQVLNDVVRGSIPVSELAQRLSYAGINSSAKNVILFVKAAERVAHTLAGIALPAGFGAAVSAIDQRALVVVLPAANHDAGKLAGALHRYLAGAGVPNSVGIGGAYASPHGLRWSYFEARDAAWRGLPVNEPEKLSLTSLLLASEDVPLADMAQETLGPLKAFDAEHGACLVHTLKQYLQLNGSLAAVAQSLDLHRNTVRYRLTQVAELTGYDPALTADRVQLWLALSVEEVR